jgi:hypothetical protein
MRIGPMRTVHLDEGDNTGVAGESRVFRDAAITGASTPRRAHKSRALERIGEVA